MKVLGGSTGSTGFYCATQAELERTTQSPAEGKGLLASGYEGLLKRRASIPFENRAILDEAGARLDH